MDTNQFFNICSEYDQLKEKMEFVKSDYEQLKVDFIQIQEALNLFQRYLNEILQKA